MAIELKMPALSPTMEEGTLANPMNTSSIWTSSPDIPGLNGTPLQVL